MENPINFKMILRRNIQKSIIDESNKDEVAECIRKLTHVRLDRENISQIDNLDILSFVTNLYLQENSIKKIENLECISSTLKFLTLSGNQIKIIEGLLPLKKLVFLDLSDNIIEKLETEKLPKSLVFVSLIGNKCSNDSNYRDSLVSALPGLKSIDGDLLTESDESDDELDEVFNDEDETTDVELKNLTMDLLERSVSRLDELTIEHKQNILDLKQLNSESTTKQTIADEFSDIENLIKNALTSVSKAEQEGCDSLFDLEESMKTLSSSSNNNCLEDQKSSKLVHTERKKENVRRNRKEFRSLGTTTSGEKVESKTASASGEKVERKTASASGIQRQLNIKSTFKSSNRPNTCENVVRIPGARPFVKQ